MKILAAVLLLAIGGCGTIDDLVNGPPHAYGGIRRDVEWFDSPCTAGLGFLDFPFSLVVDTALTPLTLPWELLR